MMPCPPKAALESPVILSSLLCILSSFSVSLTKGSFNATMIDSESIRQEKDAGNGGGIGPAIVLYK